MSRVKVIGLGNVLMGDDGFGPWMVRVLESMWEFPAEVMLEDLGTPGFDLVPHLSDADALVVLDTVKDDGRPGEVRRFGRASVIGGPGGPRLGPHDGTLRDALLALELEGRAPEVVVIGVIPERTAPGTALSPAVRDAYATAETATVRELKRLGVPGVRRAVPKEPDLWWEARPCTR